MKKKILVVDDEAPFTRLLKHALNRYEVREENDALRALATAREFQPDLILLDIIMPGLDGGDLASQLRSDPQLKSVPIVFLTAVVSGIETTAAPRQVGGFPFLGKPVSAEALIRCIEEHLGNGTKRPAPGSA